MIPSFRYSPDYNLVAIGTFWSRLVGTEKYTNWTLSGESEDIPNFKFEVRIVMYRD